jgi:glycoside/pentoside/hexuronide:cation symporter, GPH family
MTPKNADFALLDDRELNPKPLPPRLPLSVLIIYALGQMGWSLASFGTGSLLSYFYMPPETGSAPLFPSFITQSAILGGLTLLGIIASSGRLLDAFIDPLIANWSDRTKAPRLGKRRLFMALAALPLAAASFLLFFPLEVGVSALNTGWLVLMTFLYYFFFALYVIPYTALIAELGQNPADRLRISTAISVTWALGFLVGNSIYALQGALAIGGRSQQAAFQLAVGIFAVISLVLMLVPVFFLDEKKYAHNTANSEHASLGESVKAVFGIKAFQWFSVSYLLYWLSLTFIQTGIGFYVTVLMGLDKGMATLFGVIGFFTSFLFYPFMGALERLWGKKNVLLSAFLVFCVVFGIVLLPMQGIMTFYLVAFLSAYPLAVFGILPNTVVADLAGDYETRTNIQASGMFYGVSAFMMKMGVSLANLVFPSLLLFGKSTEHPLGIQLTVVAALVFCLAGYFAFRQYEQR